jgi:hypothetical protein
MPSAVDCALEFGQPTTLLRDVELVGAVLSALRSLPRHCCAACRLCNRECVISSQRCELCCGMAVLQQLTSAHVSCKVSLPGLYFVTAAAWQPRGLITPGYQGLAHTRICCQLGQNCCRVCAVMLHLVVLYPTLAGGMQRTSLEKKHNYRTVCPLQGPTPLPGDDRLPHLLQAMAAAPRLCCQDPCKNAHDAFVDAITASRRTIVCLYLH